MRNVHIFNVISTFLYHFSVHLLIFISFLLFWTVLGVLVNLEIQDGGPIWPTFGNHDVIPASCDVISSYCGRQRKQFENILKLSLL